ncbi:HlyD family secretion protein [Tautonia plasticadhaerens]|uniref:Multidrug resistance protein MdtN n=1 Tax=Tautonia plasticadhaerens TaxID=2527974 RepID=A0A518H1S0_9BACT|nr:HlyD family efflux transporter periplasmic adaptor subunit [Tautonia plasticadhaerens]QDV34770.1 Multidrug resistance protein MdtN [Tautonia plasticadhaerens]
MKAAIALALLLSATLGVASVATLKDVAAPAGSAAPEAPMVRPSDVIAADGVVEGARPEAGLRPDVEGVLAALHVAENREVAGGELLAELRNDPQRERVSLAAAELEVARARLDRLRNGERQERRRVLEAIEKTHRLALERAEADWSRTEELFGRGAISTERRDRDYYAKVESRAALGEVEAERALVEAPPRPEDLAEAEALVKAAEARLRLAEAELEKTRLRAPADGRILRAYAEPGEVVGPATPDPVLLLADLSRRRVRAFVEELDAARVGLGQPALVTADGLPGRGFSGRVSLVASRMGQNAPQSDAPGEYKDLYFREVLIDLDAGAELPVNLRVRVRIDPDPDAVDPARSDLVRYDGPD